MCVVTLDISSLDISSIDKYSFAWLFIDMFRHPAICYSAHFNILHSISYDSIYYVHIFFSGRHFTRNSFHKAASWHLILSPHPGWRKPIKSLMDSLNIDSTQEMSTVVRQGPSLKSSSNSGRFYVWNGQSVRNQSNWAVNRSEVLRSKTGLLWLRFIGSRMTSYVAF